jgi:hypothetical protein
LGVSEPLPAYEALSYAWGDPNVLLPIILNSRVAHVTENLEIALRSLRSRDQERILWIDAISINQQDATEKSKQVLQMGQIYANAFKVLVWLGSSDEDIRLGLLIFVRYARMRKTLLLKNSRTRGSGFLRAIWIKKQLQGSWFALFEALCGPLVGQKPISLADARVDARDFLGEKALAGIDKLFSSPWWSRLWVAQEYILGQSVQFVTGTYTIDSDVLYYGFMGLADLFNFGRHHRTTFPVSSSSVQLRQVLSILSHRIRRQGNDTIRWASISQPLHMTKRATCTDPRDKLFAVIGLTNDPLAKLNQPDYELSVSQVYQRFVRTWIGERKNLKILSHSQRDEKGRKLPGLPSWAPDWDHPTFNLLIPDHKDTSSPNFTASLQSSVEVFNANGAPDCLTLAGFLLDTVVKLGLRMPHSNKNAIPTGEVMQQWKSIAQMVSSDPLPFWLTRITDRLYDVRLTNSERQSLCKNISQGIPSDTGQFHEPNLWLKGPERELYWWTHRKFFITKDGRMGMAHFDVEEGDLICVLFGGQVPFVLRKSGPERFTFISECYIHGIMDGEAMKEYQQGRYTRQWFHLY